MPRRLIVGLFCAVILAVGGFVAVSREHTCAAPWQQVLLNDAAFDAIGTGLPTGWSAGAPGVRVGTFSIDGGSSVHMMGIGTWLATPTQPIQPGTHLCIAARALADSSSSTQVRTRWIWTTADGQSVTHLGAWQPVRAWAGDADAAPWSALSDTSVAPADAVSLSIRFEPSSDDRIYLDKIALRRSHVGTALPDAHPTANSPLVIRPWPAGYNAAVSFSYDFESAMGGLVHSRSVDDPNASQDPLLRAKRMREGLWNSLALYAPYGYRATYYVNGYNLLTGNPTRRRFMEDPTFTWATKANGWQSDTWNTQPWFAQDPYAADGQAPDWYFGDLLNPLRAAGHDVQSHTFSHFYGGYATTAEWQADLAAWNTLAAEQNLPPATSLAFPWSSSAGMSNANWDALEAAGITSLTRTAWNPRLPQYHIVTARDARCRELPGHERILVCPDYYLTVARTPGALAMLPSLRANDGMIDYWAHTEEVTTPEQIAAWQSVVDACATAGDIWVAPLAEIASRQRSIAALIQSKGTDSNGVFIRLHTPSAQPVTRVAVRLTGRWEFADTRLPSAIVDLAAGESRVLRIQQP